MKLCGNDAFIEGPHLDMAKKMIGRYILQPEFLALYLAEAKSAEERSSKVNELKRDLLSAGIDDDFAATG